MRVNASCSKCVIWLNRVLLFTQKTAYEMRISDWSSDVCSSDLLAGRTPAHNLHLGGPRVYMGTGGQAVKILDLDGKVRETRLSDNYDIGRLCATLDHIHFYMRQIGRASWRERVCH